MGTNPALASARRRSPLKNHFKGIMAAKGVFCFVLISALAALATSLPWEGRSKPFCACINPFLGTPNEYRGDSNALCGSGGPGFCYVPCDADCSDIQPTSSASRCQSVNACVQKQQQKQQPKPQPKPLPKPQPKPYCECINPFVGTDYDYRGDSESLCHGSDGPGFCYVPCNADCSDIRPSSSGSRCQSVNACDVQGGIKLLAAPGK